MTIVKDCPAGGLQRTIFASDASGGGFENRFLTFSQSDVEYSGQAPLRISVELVSTDLPWGSAEVEDDVERIPRWVEDLPGIISATAAGAYEFEVAVWEDGGGLVDSWRCSVEWSHVNLFAVEHHLRPGYLPDRKIHVLRDGARPYDVPGDATWCNREDHGPDPSVEDDSHAHARLQWDGYPTVDGSSRAPEDVTFEVVFETVGYATAGGDTSPEHAGESLSETRLYVNGELALTVNSDPAADSMQSMFMVEYSPLLTYPSVVTTDLVDALPEERLCP